jgi:hypothetical protein
VRLHVRKSDTLRSSHGSECANLISDQIFHLAWCRLQLSASEPDEIGKSRMSSDCGSVFTRQRDRSSHHTGISGVETTRNVGRRQDRNERRIMAYLVGAKRLADIAIQIDLHGPNVSRTAV